MAQQAAEEISNIICNKVIPEFEGLKTTTELSALWRQGSCPGLTERQRKEYL
ncbi:hypothetical protein OCK74_09125 [Chitinophagaceae bacterium LB-8]|jgi:hypothetical protein|uniref:Uncharacterized protein n=1 Tax=Paraflavisolibacter caeni TaxID=2982496 RepID=A0A9X3BHB4_9BACT|nr:hypothetical protein [Paraflavisolibacter caeni]MCU7549277.1 hypothetical protein [Paraflavisolibacter caeni]